jgi:hypothetical protein
VSRGKRPPNDSTAETGETTEQVVPEVPEVQPDAESLAVAASPIFQQAVEESRRSFAEGRGTPASEAFRRARERQKQLANR